MNIKCNAIIIFFLNFSNINNLYKIFIHPNFKFLAKISNGNKNKNATNINNYDSVDVFVKINNQNQKSYFTKNSDNVKINRIIKIENGTMINNLTKINNIIDI